MSLLILNELRTLDGKVTVPVRSINQLSSGSITELKSVTVPTGAPYLLLGRDDGTYTGGGHFAYIEGDFSNSVAADPLQGIYIAPDTDPTGETGVWVRQSDGRGVDPRWFGAQADGVADDSAAIQAALNISRHVYLHPGRYRITEGLYLGDGGHLEGPNAPAHIGVQWDSDLNEFVLPPGMSAIAVDFGAGGSGNIGCPINMRNKSTVSGLSFYYPSQPMFTEGNTISSYPATITLDPTFYTENPSGSIESVSVIDCHFCNPWQAIRWNTRHALGLIRHCTGYAWDNAISIDESYDVERIIECQFNATLAYIGEYNADNMYGYQGSRPDSASIRIGKADACRIIGTFAYGFYKGLHIAKFNTGAPNGVYVVGGGWEGSVQPLYALDFYGVYFTGVMFGADTIGYDSGQPYSTMPPAEHAIVLSGTSSEWAQDARFVNCTVWRARFSAVDANYVNRITLTGCTFNDANNEDRGFVTGSLAFGNCNNVKVTSCHVQADLNNPNSQYLNMIDCSSIIYKDCTHLDSPYLDGWYLGDCAAGYIGDLIEQNTGGGVRKITTTNTVDVNKGDLLQW